MSQVLPTTGRIGRFAKIMIKTTDERTARLIMKGFEKYPSYNNIQKSKWWKETIKRSEDIIGIDKIKDVLIHCGQMCCGITSRRKVKLIKTESSSLEDLISKLNQKGLGGGRFKLKNKNTIIGGYSKCYCGQVKYANDSFDNLTYCHCSTGWYKQLFETALGKPVRVEIKKSIIAGSDSCEFVIHI